MTPALKVKESTPMNPTHASLPSSRELAGLFQDEFAAATGLPARWAAEELQGNTGQLHTWEVPFHGEKGLRGSFKLRWDAELTHLLSARVGQPAQRPEYLGAILRAAAGRWASWQALRSGHSVRLLPSPEAQPGAERATPWRSSAALLVDRHAIELCFSLETAPA